MSDLEDLVADALEVAVSEAVEAAKRQTGDKDPRYRSFRRRESAEILIRELRRVGVRIELPGS